MVYAAGEITWQRFVLIIRYGTPHPSPQGGRLGWAPTHSTIKQPHRDTHPASHSKRAGSQLSVNTKEMK